MQGGGVGHVEGGGVGTIVSVARGFYYAVLSTVNSVLGVHVL